MTKFQRICLCIIAAAAALTAVPHAFGMTTSEARDLELCLIVLTLIVLSGRA